MASCLFPGPLTTENRLLWTLSFFFFFLACVSWCFQVIGFSSTQSGIHKAKRKPRELTIMSFLEFWDLWLMSGFSSHCVYRNHCLLDFPRIFSLFLLILLFFFFFLACILVLVILDWCSQELGVFFQYVVSIFFFLFFFSLYLFSYLVIDFLWLIMISVTLMICMLNCVYLLSTCDAFY